MRSLRLLLATLPLLGACAAPHYVAPSVARVVSEAAPGVTHLEGSFQGFEGVKLFEQSWTPKDAPAKAVVVMMHGLKDHSSRYGETAQKLVSRGYAVYAFDLRGHGWSEGDRVWVSQFDDYLEDLDLFIKSVQKREPGKPLFLFGHSMGGAIVTLYTITRKPALAGLELSGAALKPGAELNAFVIRTTKILGVITPSLAVMELDPKLFSRDPEVVKENQADPVVYQGKGPAHTAAQILKAIARIQEGAEELTVPLLVMHGGADVVTDPEGSKALVEKAKSTDKTLKIYDGLFHDLLHEPEKEKVYGDLLEWMEKRAPLTPTLSHPAPESAEGEGAPRDFAAATSLVISGRNEVPRCRSPLPSAPRGRHLARPTGAPSPPGLSGPEMGEGWGEG